MTPSRPTFGGVDNFSVMIDTGLPGPRYKALAYPKIIKLTGKSSEVARERYPKGLYAAESDDGIHWTTRPIRFQSGSNLCVNADIRGELRVSVHRVRETERGRQGAKCGFIYFIEDTLPGYAAEEPAALTGNATRMELRWKERRALPDDQEWFALRFHLRDSDIYSFWAE